MDGELNDVDNKTNSKADAEQVCATHYAELARPLKVLLLDYASFEQKMATIKRFCSAIEAVSLAADALSDAESVFRNIPAGRTAVAQRMIQERKQMVEDAQVAFRRALCNCQAVARDCKIVIHGIEQYNIDISKACRLALDSLQRDIHFTAYCATNAATNQ